MIHGLLLFCLALPSSLGQRKAWEGASTKDRAQHHIATSSGQVNHHKLQRRMTSTSRSSTGR